MKQTTAFILLGSLALGSIAAGIAGAIHEKRKSRKHKPAATLRDLYEDNAASDPSLFDDSSESSPLFPGLSSYDMSNIEYEIANTPLVELL